MSCLLRLPDPHHCDSKSETSTDNDDHDFPLDHPLPRPSKAKSSLCKNFTDKGHCPYGSRCQFAHGPQELRINLDQNRSYKTKECQAFRKGACSYGQRCNFIHRPEPLCPHPHQKWSRIYSNFRDLFRGADGE